MEIKEKKKIIIDITKPEDVDNVKRGQWMHFTCKRCGKDTTITFAGNKYINRYKRLMCTMCAKKQTWFEKYGVENPLQLPEIQEKIKQTNLEKLGTEYPSQSPKVREKIKQANIEKYGVENPSQAPEIKEKKKQTCLKHYGTENPLQSPENQEKSKQTCLEKYGAENPFQSPEIQEKIKQTNLEKYGTEYPLQSPEIQEKMKHTNLEKYGTEYSSQSPEIQEKMKQTWFENYGVESPFQSLEIQEKIKQTNLEKLGTEYPSQSPKVREKIKQTNLEKYGVENPSQSPEFQGIKKYNYFGVKFDSSWELYYYIYQTEVLGLDCVRNLGEKYFEYVVNGKTHRYIPDFINEGKIVEIKGDHFLKNGNLINVYDKHLSKVLLSAKTQCMIANTDEIITRKEITPMIKEVKRLFGTHYIDQFKVNKNEEGLEAS